jgi:hypothetical protein
LQFTFLSPAFFPDSGEKFGGFSLKILKNAVLNLRKCVKRIKSIETLRMMRYTNFGNGIFLRGSDRPGSGKKKREEHPKHA